MTVLRLFTLTLVLSTGVGVATAAGQQDPQWQVGLSSFASSGDYGTADTTRLIFTTLSVRRMFPRGDVTVRVPWLDVRSDGTVLVFRDVPQPVPTRRGARAAATPLATRQTTRESGLGDAGITGRYFLVDDRAASPAVDLVARVKLPPGDDARGLGLGAASVEMGVELTKSLGPVLIALGSASYTVAGRPEDLEVRNPWEYSLGIGAYLGRLVLVSAAYEQWRPVIPLTPAGRDLLTTGTIMAGRLRILLSAQIPLSDQAPDVAAGAGLAVRF
jgi:hypothetical protein